MRRLGLLQEHQTRFFAAELLLALEHLHLQHIVHRGAYEGRGGANL